MIWLPDEIRRIIGSRHPEENNIGKSASRVICYEDMVLKAGPVCEENRDAIAMMDWLCGKLPVPEILVSKDVDNTNYLLMSRIPGKMACHRAYMEQPKLLVKLLAEALQMLWSVDTSGCHCLQNLDKKLAQAERFVANGECSTEDAEPGTYGEEGFSSPAHLLQWLKENRPQETAFLSHGDFCLPNVFFSENRVSGFIDLDHCGIADPWQDIALCYRSLVHNSHGKYGNYPAVCADDLFVELGIAKDTEKLRYYILLDELF